MSEEIDRWIAYMKNNPNTWKSEHSKFINAQFDKSKKIIIKLTQMPKGKEKIKSIYNIKNVKGYNKLLK